MHPSCDITSINTKTYPCFLSIKGVGRNSIASVHSIAIGRCSRYSWPTPSLCHHWDLETYLWSYKGKRSWHNQQGRDVGERVVSKCLSSRVRAGLNIWSRLHKWSGRRLEVAELKKREIGEKHNSKQLPLTRAINLTNLNIQNILNWIEISCKFVGRYFVSTVKQSTMGVTCWNETFHGWEA